MLSVNCAAFKDSRSSFGLQQMLCPQGNCLTPGQQSGLRQDKSGARSAGKMLFVCLTLERWIYSQPWGLFSSCWLFSHITKDSHGPVTPQSSLKIRAGAVTAEGTVVLDSFSCSSWQLSLAEHTKEMPNIPWSFPTLYFPWYDPF